MDTFAAGFDSYDEEPGETAEAFDMRISYAADIMLSDEFFFDIYDLMRLFGNNGPLGTPQVQSVLADIRNVSEAYALRRELAARGQNDRLLTVAIPAMKGFAPAARAIAEWYQHYLSPEILARMLLGVRRLPYDDRTKLFGLVPKFVADEEKDLLWCHCRLLASASVDQAMALKRRLDKEGDTFSHLLEQCVSIADEKLVAQARENALSHGLLPNGPADDDAPSIIDNPDDGRPIVDVFSPDDVASVNEHYDKERQSNGEQASIIKRLRSAAGRKPLAVIPSDWEQRLDGFAQDFPNFGEAIELLRGQFALSACADGRVQFPHLLFLGPPGVGKTEWTSRLASHVDTDVLKIDMSNLQTNHQLAGSERYWANSSPSDLFKTLALGRTANPIVMLDEIDKASSANGYDPCSPLYPLLERTTAKVFRDLSLPDIPLDASHVLWVATANDVRDIPDPLLSRFTVISVPKPSWDESCVIVGNIYREMRAQALWGSFFDEQPSDDVVSHLALLSPRRARAALRRAFGRAALQRRKTLQIADLPPENDGRRAIGFV